ncbi:hypothetical protein NB706_002780 [Xanthomonas sacchari]|nr:hypothetical protein [Xanthomonas sacchari]
MLSRVLRNGSRLNCWNTTPQWSARKRSRAALRKVARSCPATRTQPAVGCSTPAIKASKVLLPDPLAPRSNSCCPRGSANDAMSSTGAAAPG